MRTIITYVNPWSKVTIIEDITTLTEDELSVCAALMDEKIREEIHRDLAPCKPAEFLAEYVRRVGPEAAGIILCS